jgi:hypothetical protein
VALAGVAAYSEGNVGFDLLPEAGGDTIEVTVRPEGDTLIFTAGGVQTPGKRNMWVRLNKADSNTFGSDTECEVWIGRVAPPTKDTQQGAQPRTEDGAG